MSENKDRNVFFIPAVVAVAIVTVSVGFVIVRRVLKNKERPRVQLLIGRDPFNVMEIKSLMLRKEEEDGTVISFIFEGETLKTVTVERRPDPFGGATIEKHAPNSPNWHLWQEKYQQAQAEYANQYRD